MALINNVSMHTCRKKTNTVVGGTPHFICAVLYVGYFHSQYHLSHCRCMTFSQTIIC